MSKRRQTEGEIAFLSVANCRGRKRREKVHERGKKSLYEVGREGRWGKCGRGRRVCVHMNRSSPSTWVPLATVSLQQRIGKLRHNLIQHHQLPNTQRDSYFSLFFFYYFFHFLISSLLIYSFLFFSTHTQTHTNYPSWYS